MRYRPMAQAGRIAACALGLCALGSLGLGAAGCDRPPSPESLREWTPADHHSADDDKLAMAAGARASSPPATKGGAASAAQIAQLVDITWRQQCATCHGAGGRGDGQMGPMLHATDLTNADWQKRTTDAEMAAVITTGKNRMPRFDLPASVVTGLVARIRALRAGP